MVYCCKYLPLSIPPHAIYAFSVVTIVDVIQVLSEMTATTQYLGTSRNFRRVATAVLTYHSSKCASRF